MCGICGCGPHSHSGSSEHHGSSGHHGPEHHHAHTHTHAHDEHEHEHDDEQSRAQRRVLVEQDLLATNDKYAQVHRALLEKAKTFAVNLMSSPGSGKTTLLCRTLDQLRERWPLAVIEGDQQTDNDAERIRQTGVPAFQVNTGKGCHLDAAMMIRALESQPLPEGGMLFIENVGNLVCPAGFDLGEHRKVVVASVTEGEDKPLKYPDMFAVADLVLINKVDLVPYLSFDFDRLVDNAKRINPNADILPISATSGAGFSDWLAWLETTRNAIVGRSESETTALEGIH